MFALAKEGQAFRIFERKGWWNVPIYSVAVSALPGLIAFVSIKASAADVNSQLPKNTKGR